ncbi:MAG: hypothetical protein NTY93_02110, partial [Candidatus Kaiserbacteria bacterium]|nr:hypothetical protein [Candidatus Kaiserbacteria bacterium]
MNSLKNNTVLVAYVPVPHAGYLKLFRAYKGDILYVLGNEFIQEFPSLTRHLPGVTPQESRKMIQALDIFSSVRILTKNVIDTLQLSDIVMPDEDVSHVLAEKYFAGALITFDGCWRLRWDWGSTQAKRRPEGERIISTSEFNRTFMRFASSIADKSPD